MEAKVSYLFKPKDSEIKRYAPCLGNISNDFTTNNIKKKNRIKGVLLGLRQILHMKGL